MAFLFKTKHYQNEKKMQKAALRVVFNDYTADYSQLLSMSKRSPLLIVRLRALLIEFSSVSEN